MDRPFRPRARPPRGLVLPVPVDPAGVSGPTPGQARGPGWRRTSPRLYVPADTPGEPEQRILEQAQRLPPEGAVGGWASLRLHGVAYVAAQDLPVPLLVPPPRRMRELPGGVVRREELAPHEVVRRHGVPCVEPVRAAVDEAARATDLRAAIVQLDMVLAAGVTTPSALASYAARSRGRGAWQVRTALLLVDGRSLSPAESWLRTVWVLDAQLPPPLCNWPVHDAAGRYVGKADLLCPPLATRGEYDGAEHRRADRRSNDLDRDDRFAAVGLESFTVVGRDRHDLGKVVARMHAAVERARVSGRPRTWRLAVDPGPP
ncbi:hypothetical protein [Nocardioides aurantiacus]|uniref:hypothetical protein n=1 Tax=Nocardioides aurantiacus TaxID=86796 RepID=UPI0011CD8F12|nr:hypothetical protein [Nocardioides aurantiacus]